MRYGLNGPDAPWLETFWEHLPHLKAFVEAGRALTPAPDIWMANDWEMLPVAEALRAECGGKIFYDSHEFAADQFSHKPSWVKWKKPLVSAVEKNLIGQADAVSAVSPGICGKFQEIYQLADKPVCIRNVPAYQETSFRKTGDTITCLFHGILSSGRGLEELIRSTALWQDRFRLVIRGPEGEPGYVRQLETVLAETDTDIPILLAPPIPMDELITKARDADIGIMALAVKSVHNQFALPNKIFEYIMAGLGLCVTTNQDMADLVTDHRNGVLIKSLSPEDIAVAINSLTPELVDQYKEHSLNAARDLNWENEKKKLLALAEGMIARES